jgi:hypothetical protein
MVATCSHTPICKALPVFVLVFVAAGTGLVILLLCWIILQIYLLLARLLGDRWGMIVMLIFLFGFVITGAVPYTIVHLWLYFSRLV